MVARLCYCSWLWLISSVLLETHAIWPFPSETFTVADTLTDGGALGLGDDDRVIALGDFNGDQLCILLCLLRLAHLTILL